MLINCVYLKGPGFVLSCTIQTSCLIGGLPLRERGSEHSKGGKRLIGFTIYKFPPQPHDVSAALGTVPFRSNKQYQVSQHLRRPSGGPIYKYTALLFYVSQTRTSGVPLKVKESENWPSSQISNKRRQSLVHSQTQWDGD